MIMKFCISALLLVGFSVRGACQKNVPTLNCRGDILDVGVAIKGFPSCSHCEIKKDALRDGFSIVLSDSTYKIVAFRIGYYNANRLLFEKDIFGNKVDKEKADFLSKLKAGDLISVECINIEKDKRRCLSTSILIAVGE